MPPLNMRSTATASSSIDIELPVDDDARDIGLELHERFGLGQLIVTAVGAGCWEGNIVGFVDLLGHRSAVMLSVILAAFASRFLRIGFAFLSERSRLAFAFALHFLESLLKQLDVPLHLLDDLQQSLATRAIGIGFGHFHDA